MYEPKAIDHLTDNGKHILIYEYLKFPVTIMLASDVVLGIEPETDSITVLAPNEDQIYEEISHISTTKPSRGHVTVELSAHNLSSIKKYDKGQFYDEEFFRNKFVSLLMQYFKR